MSPREPVPSHDVLRVAAVALKLGAGPYTWGGRGPLAPRVGLDCSGYVMSVLRAVGLAPAGADASTRDMELWPRVAPDDVRPGDVALRSSGGHVRLVVWPGYVEADSGGGGRESHPGGRDWPTKGRWPRLFAPSTSYNYRRSPWAGGAS